MGWMYAVGPCWVCGKPFMFNADSVPSMRDENGIRQPVCRECMEQVNRERVTKGLKPHHILDNAYEPQEKL